MESLILGVLGASFDLPLGLGAGSLALTVPGWPMVIPYGWIGLAVSACWSVSTRPGAVPGPRPRRE